MKILSIELSTKVGSIALLEDGKICKEIKWEEHFKDRRQPFDALDQLDLDWSSIDLFVAGRGPGSFSGLRVAFSVVNALALPYQKKVIAHNSAVSMLTQFDSSEVVVVGDARRNQLWIGKFKKLKLIGEFKLIKYDELPLYISEQTIVVSSDYNRLSNLLHEFQEPIFRKCFYPSAGELAKLVYEKIKIDDKFEDFTPLYLHPPVFVEPKYN